jgi:hypothetical protein
MKRRRPIRLVFWVLFSFWGTDAGAQISPGELSAAHAALEGLGNCTACHTLGKSVEEARCFACHTELGKRVRAGKGYHANLRSQACVQCHREHHGREFTLIRWNPKSLDHRLTGFELVGKHRSLECRACHNPSHIADREVAASRSTAPERTYLGLSAGCASCHRDPHAGSLGGECTKCHTSDAWKPAPGFAHDRTAFPLSGKHRTVRCELCHGGPGAPGKPVRFVGLAFRACADCHRDPHAGKFKERCEGCHTTEGWESAGRGFNHARTRFPLKGKHAVVACVRCHPASGTSQKARFVVAKFSRCADCHATVHGRQFASRRVGGGGDCAGCHNEQGWRPSVIPLFDHGATRFPLRGKHAAVACVICHVPQKKYGPTVSTVSGMAFAACTPCHADVHRAQFASRGDGGRCESCHGEGGFRPSTYVASAHAAARFPLQGAHEAVPCDRCHTVASGGVRTFRWEKLPQCSSCHRDVHGGEFASLGAGCASCHSARAWGATAYDHRGTRFRLDGKHRLVSCAGCHRTGVGRDIVWRFKGTPVECAGCHTGRRTG